MVELFANCGKSDDQQQVRGSDRLLCMIARRFIESTDNDGTWRSIGSTDDDGGDVTAEEEEIWSLSFSRWCNPDYTLRIEECITFIDMFNGISNSFQRDTLFLLSPAHALASPLQQLDWNNVNIDTVRFVRINEKFTANLIHSFELLGSLFLSTNGFDTLQSCLTNK